MIEITPQNVHETLSRHILADGFDVIFDAKGSHGAYMRDARTGRDYLDLFSFFGTRPLGFNHPKLKDPAFLAKMHAAAVDRPTLSDIYTTEFAEFVEAFSSIAGKGIFKHFFFVEGGAMGVENAIKVAFDWKVRKNLAAGRGEKGSQVIHFREAFHGRSGYTLSLTNTEDPRKHMYYAKFPWPRITNPKLRFPLTEASLNATIAEEKKAVAEIQEALKKNPNDIAALIIEPIQSEGGDNHFRPEFLKELRRLADENEFMLIFDEVQTGLGLTGKTWCFENYGVTPDLIAFGKKAQIGGCASTARVDDVPGNVFQEPSRLNSTWGGNLVDMIRCTHFLRIMQQDKLVDYVATTGPYFLNELERIANENPAISNVRGRGFLIAFDLPTPEKRAAMRTKLYENGAILLACGHQSIRIRPHLDLSKQAIDHALELIRKSVKQI